MLLTGSRYFYLLVLLLVMVTAGGATAWTQTFQVIHYLSPQGYNPADGLAADSAGNLYGTTVTAIATKPVVVLHTGVKGTCNNNRN